MSSILLLIATAVALLCANTSLLPFYQSCLEIPFLGISVHAWVNDALMGIFFLTVGLEIKHEFVEGELASRSKALLPVMAALGGMLVPALIYFLFNQGSPTALGWGVPMATDIAFAVSVLSVLGNRIPRSLKLFLLTLAVVDDLGSIVVIALFYSQQAGIHVAVLGVLLAILLPMKIGRFLETHLQPWVIWMVMPLFALANAGVVLMEANLWQPVGLGVLFALVLGKPLGILSFSWLAVCSKWASLPNQVTWKQMTGVACLGGIGFTVAIFMSNLAFHEDVYNNSAKMAVLIASIVSAVLGLCLLRRA